MATGPKKGLNPLRKVGSSPDNGGLSTYTIASGYGTSIGLGDPVKLHTDGTLVKATNGDPALGAFAGVEYTDSTGATKFSKIWIASTVATNIQALVKDDPFATFQAVAEGPIPLVIPGDIFTMNLTNPDTTFGNSTATVKTNAEVTGNVALPASGALVGQVAGMANGDTFTIKASDASVATTITIETATTRAQFLAALNAVNGISATVTSDNYINLEVTNGYDLVLAAGSGAPLTDMGLAAGTYSEVVAAADGLVKVISVIDPVTYALEVTIVDDQLRGNS